MDGSESGGVGAGSFLGEGAEAAPGAGTICPFGKVGTASMKPKAGG